MSDIRLQATNATTALTVSDMQASLRFYTEGLGFEIGTRHEEAGVLRYASLKAGNAFIGIGQDDFAKGRDRTKGIGMRIWISTTQDVTALATRAQVAGITLDDEPAALPWGPMAFAVTDPDGFKVTVAQDG